MSAPPVSRAGSTALGLSPFDVVVDLLVGLAIFAVVIVVAATLMALLQAVLPGGSDRAPASPGGEVDAVAGATPLEGPGEVEAPAVEPPRRAAEARPQSTSTETENQAAGMDPPASDTSPSNA